MSAIQQLKENQQHELYHLASELAPGAALKIYYSLPTKIEKQLILKTPAEIVEHSIEKPIDLKLQVRTI